LFPLYDHRGHRDKIGGRIRDTVIIKPQLHQVGRIPLRPVVKHRLIGSLDQGAGAHQPIKALLRFFQQV